MFLDRISAPADLRDLSIDELNQLADEIRRFIVRAVSVTGGHLGSNLGVVELTIALHRVFDCPKDVLLWDTGHLAYPHKILTGRRDRFSTLRQEGGLSGYPSRAESEFDYIENSHASTVLSYAHGFSQALNGSGRRVIGVIGDGSMTGGMAYEALNNIGHSGANVITVLNDNGRSYAPTVSHLSYPLLKLRTHPTYVRERKRAQRWLRSIPHLGRTAEAGFAGVRAVFREVIEPRAFFEALGVQYYGPFDGHNITELEDALRVAADAEGPVLVHVVTQKGRGYPPAEDDDEKNLHDAPVFDPVVGPPQGWSAPKGYTQGFSETLLELAAEDERIHAITAAMPGPTGLIPFQKRYPDRFHDVGIAEQHAATMAAGMAMGGLKPVVAVYSTFFTRCFDQANYDVGLHGLDVVFALDRAGVTGDDGPSHHGVLDIGLALKIPGMAIFCPSSVQELAVMLREAVNGEGPALVRYPKGVARSVEREALGSGRLANRTREGDGSVCLLAVGKMAEAAEGAADKLAVEGTHVTVWDARLVRPADSAMIADAARHSLVVTVEDGMVVGGAGEYFSQLIADHSERKAGVGSGEGPRVVTLGTPDQYMAHAKPQVILARLGLDTEGLVETIKYHQR